MSNKKNSSKGKITQVIGSVLDIAFENDRMPEIFEALEMEVDRFGKKEKLVAEVQQHLGGQRVRAVALSSADGLIRGQEVTAVGAPISVPVGESTLGRIFNVLGDVVDEGPALQVKERMPIHREAPAMVDLEPKTEIFETGIKVI
ncbi:MAG: F0F1 ATP synthase subunit beta, partial [Leptonema sp. (in: Bacteria)]|nr:F0F1 ATP synthase subunit beta [Leptonema sp. (in: bacteria)]